MKQFVTGLLLISLTITSATPAISNSFTSDLTYAITHEKAGENVVFSPASIKSVLALAYLGAESTTATEFKTVLNFSTANKEETANEFGQLLEKTKNSESAKLQIANRVYVGDKYSVVPKFNELASKYFDSGAENVKFSDTALAANKINAWVEEKTDNKIQNLIDPSSLTAETIALLVNAIYFKAEWINTFNADYTATVYFSVSKTHQVVVEMMLDTNDRLYAELNDLNAIAVELPYKDTDLSMLIILPKEIDGLANLEAKLKDIDITKISNEFSKHCVELHLPKFKIEFDIKLNDVLQKLGLNSMFSDSADFSGLFGNGVHSKINEVKHKAFIEIYEIGTEAAAATVGGVMRFMGLPQYKGVTYFNADHPFFFAIKDNKNVYFAGHVATF